MVRIAVALLLILNLILLAGAPLLFLVIDDQWEGLPAFEGQAEQAIQAASHNFH